MPTQTKEDPKSYVRRVPIPIPSHQGVRIQARSQEVYSATVPTRDEIRRRNYFRRSDQLERQGFSAFNYKPYKGIGDPFYLDEKRLILSALGQIDANDDDDSFSSSDDESLNLDSRAGKRPQTPRKYIYKSGKFKSNLAKEVKLGREMMKNVRLGHGFFDLMEKQIQQRNVAKAEEERVQQERKKSNWQPPKSDSDSEGSDIENYMKAVVEIKTPHSTVAAGSDIAVCSTPQPASGRSPRSPRPQTGKKRCTSSRPYTPIHSSLLNPEPDLSKTSALFRQLCVLHWLLEAMNNDSSSPMYPIMTSWNLREIGGHKVSPRKVVQDRNIDNSWTTFKTSPVTLYPPQSKRASNVMFNIFSATKKWGASASRRTTRKISINQAQAPRSGSIMSVDGAGAAGGAMTSLRPPSAAKSSSDASDKEVEDEDVNKSLFSFLDEYYLSLRKKESGTNIDDGATGATDMEARMTSASGERHRRRRTPEEKAARRAARRPESGRDSGAGGDGAQTWRTSSTFIRPKSSPALIEFQNTAQSNKYTTLTSNLRRELSLVEEEKMADVQEDLENWERTRLRNCRSKFNSLSTDCSIVEKAIRTMRQSTLAHKRRERIKYQNDPSSWYTELLNKLPPNVKDIWYFQQILEKLSNYVDNGKHSCIKFLKALATLREWEICSPDVSAAVEFCREKIAEQSVEDFEKWFKEHFPNVERPPATPLATQVDRATRATSSASPSDRTTRTTVRPKTTGSLRSKYS